ncbi:protease SohB [Pseudidiomarina donghaiensis]|uniref:Protease SohB n=1 Tax=Pseudidiomarina donghaiensis TaxID=519452 RepID=A0A432XL71_9GAMM|nr:protease SohB [Pseudidiomarina donghaiensis]RUO49441.1 protease SohB [Pseudidiomarina donghaiensis]SFV21249.1 serine protease SohB [Pseudidiomarina donghaiensis]
MWEVGQDLLVFVLKAAIIVFAVMLIVGVVAQAAQRQKSRKGELVVDRLSDDLRDGVHRLKLDLLDKKHRKKAQKELKKKQKTEEKAETRKRLFVIDFKGSMDAHEVDSLRREVNAVVAVAEPGEQVLVRLESPGGVVHGYGLGASQLQRLRDAQLELIVSVDKVAASGGYMMAAVANHIQAAPFAIIGSIGVLAQIPNFHRWLKKHDVDFEQVTAGEYKRTLTMFGENTDEGRRKFKQDMENIHEQFKAHIQQFRPDLDLDKVATGEYWTAQEALQYGLVDSLTTSDAWLLERRESHDMFLVRYVVKKNIGERVGRNVSAALAAVKNFLGRAES